jgi:hypothetical protein
VGQLAKFQQVPFCANNFFDVANAKAAYRAANVFAPPSPMAQLFINCYPRGRKTAGEEKIGDSMSVGS